MSLSLRYAARSHVGLIRDGNEDSGYASARLLVIADGMGGQAAGELASAVAVETLAELDSPSTTGLTGDPVRDLDERVRLANTKIRDIIAQRPELEGMGTTVTALFLAGANHLAFAHIGDSRAYRLRAGVLEQLSTDHTWVQRLIDEGQITEDEASRHPQRSLLMRALGTSGEVDLDLTVLDLQPGDRYLLCSDGLSGFVPFNTLASTLSGYGDPHHAAETLIQHALRGGGADNITCIVADAYEPPTGNGRGSQAETQYLELPVVVGAAAENQGGLPAYSAAASAQPKSNPADPGVTGLIPTTAAAAVAEPAAAEPLNGPLGGASSGDTAELEAVKDEGGRRRPKWVKPTAIAASCVIVVGALAGGAYLWTQQQYYVGVDTSGHVAIYQGVDMTILGVGLSHVYTEETVTLAALPTDQQAKVRASITATSLGDAQSIVSTLATFENTCTAIADQSSAPSSPSAIPTTPAAPSASASPSIPLDSAGKTPGAINLRPSGTAHASAETGLAATENPVTTAPSDPAAVTPPASSPSPSSSLGSGVAGLNQLSAHCPPNPGASGSSGTS